MGTRGPVSQPWQSHCAHDTRTHRRHCLPITEHLAPAAAAQCPPGTPTPPTSASPSSPVASRTLPVLPHHLEGGQKGASPCSPHQPIAQSARTPCNETLQLQPTTQLQSHQPDSPLQKSLRRCAALQTALQGCSVCAASVPTSYICLGTTPRGRGPWPCCQGRGHGQGAHRACFTPGAPPAPQLPLPVQPRPQSPSPHPLPQPEAFGAAKPQPHTWTQRPQICHPSRGSPLPEGIASSPRCGVCSEPQP